MILVTGATGLVGSHLTATLLKQGKKVRALYRNENRKSNVREVLSYYQNDADDLFSRIEWVEGNVTDIFSLEEALTGVDEVYHCAGFISFDERESKKLHKINAEGTANLVNISLEKNIKKFCHVSSVATLQIQANRKYIDELSVWKTASGTSSYAISKYRGEFEAWRGMSEGLNVLVVNPSVVLGAGCWGQSSGAIITRMKKGISFYTEGITGYVDVRDVANCMIGLMDENKFGARYILNSENLSVQYLSNELRRLFGKKPSNLKAGSFLLNLARYGDSVRCFFSGKPRLITKSIVASAQEKNYFDNSRIRKELGYSFIPVSESLAYITDRYNAFLQSKK